MAEAVMLPAGNMILTCACGGQNPRDLPYDMTKADACSTCGKAFGRPCVDPRQGVEVLPHLLEVVDDGKVQPASLGYHNMGSYGRCDWTHLREAVSEATCGSRTSARPYDDTFFQGHQMVDGINYNSLDRIVTAFVDAEIANRSSGEVELVSRAIHEHLCRRDIFQYLDNDEDCRGLARAAIAALANRPSDAVAGEG